MLETNNWRFLQRKILDVVFPPSRRTRVVRSLTKEDLQSLPQAESPEQDKVFALFEYADETVRQIVQATKYDGCSRGAQIIGYLLYDHLLEICAEKRIISKEIFLVPIPLSQQRLQKRGFNQCNQIITHICKQDDDNTFQNLRALKKPTPTQPQARLTKSQRQKNIAGLFSLDGSVSVTDKNIIVIDDVTTTGATFTEAQKTLQTGNPKSVHAVAFAH